VILPLRLRLPRRIALFLSCPGVVDRIDLPPGLCRATASWMCTRELHNANNCALRLVSGLGHLQDHRCPRFSGLRLLTNAHGPHTSAGFRGFAFLLLVIALVLAGGRARGCRCRIIPRCRCRIPRCRCRIRRCRCRIRRCRCRIIRRCRCRIRGCWRARVGRRAPSQLLRTGGHNVVGADCWRCVGDLVDKQDSSGCNGDHEGSW
jgi:hypothetical protein